MPKIFTSLLLGLMISAITDSPKAAVIETWQFGQGGYTSLAGDFSGVGALTGSFTGTVEPNGFISLADLTSFTASWSFDLVPASLARLTLFSFNTNGTGSSLAIEGSTHGGLYSFCVGAVTTLDAPCGPALFAARVQRCQLFLSWRHP